MKRLRELLVNTSLVSGLLLVSFLVGGVFGLLQIVLVHYFGWYTWGDRVTWILFIALIIYVACKIPWESPKEPE